MSADAPAEPPPEEPSKSIFEKLGAALPVGLTAIATAFAGLSTSEMTQAMYWRSAAAQDQAKANDQWSLAGFKRDRSLIVQTAAAQLRAAAGYRGLPEVNVGGDPQEQYNPPSGAAEWLRGSGPPKVKLPFIAHPNIVETLDAIREHRPEEELIALAKPIARSSIDRAIAEAEDKIVRVDHDWASWLRATDGIVQRQLDAVARAGEKDRAEKVAQASAVQAARYELENRRYRAEATLNQELGYLYELRVKVSTAESDRHRDRSKNFFYAMLAAQVGATVASLGLARRRKSAFWTLAGVAGIVAVAFGAYVYVGM
jgi:hypothetical protein